jgi:uncharacterized protein YcaQ
MTTRTLSIQDARRLAIRKQHLHNTQADMLDVLRDIGCLQLDPISAVERSHLLVLWSRLGSYAREDFERLVYHDRQLFEFWAHEASFVLTEDYPIHHWYMRYYPGDSAWQQRIQAWLDSDPEGIAALKQHLLETMRREGPKAPREFEDTLGREDGVSSGWTGKSSVNKLLDYLWHKGEVMVAWRKGNTRHWDLAERCLPDWTPREHLDDEQVTQRAAQKALRALGVGTATQINAHFTRRRYPTLRETVAALLDDGTVERVQVLDDEGNALRGDWLIHCDDLALLEAIQSGQWAGQTTLLSPFDNLICDRKRTEELFGFEFRIEIYVPKNKRQYGYYVLPILHHDRLIGRIDSYMDSKTDTLHFNAVYAEPDAPDSQEAVSAIRDAAGRLAGWLGANEIVWGDVPANWHRL